MLTQSRNPAQKLKTTVLELEGICRGVQSGEKQALECTVRLMKYATTSTFNTRDWHSQHKNTTTSLLHLLPPIHAARLFTSH